MRIVATILLILAASLFLGTNVVLACDCVELKPPDAFQNADAVFIGKVIEKGGWFNPYVEFRVEKAWKSNDSDEITVYIDDDCGDINFIKGESFVVYAYRKEGNYLYTDNCSGTAKLKDAEEHLKYLGSKNPITVTKKFLNRNVRIGLITGALILAFLGIGYAAMRVKKRAA